MYRSASSFYRGAEMHFGVKNDRRIILVSLNLVNSQADTHLNGVYCAAPLRIAGVYAVGD